MHIEGREIRRRGCLFIVSGPSGAGKTSICAPALAELEGIDLSVSITTRSPRKGEKDGESYRFVDDAEFVRGRWSPRRHGHRTFALLRLSHRHGVLLLRDVRVTDPVPRRDDLDAESVVLHALDGSTGHFHEVGHGVRKPAEVAVEPVRDGCRLRRLSTGEGGGALLTDTGLDGRGRRS